MSINWWRWEIKPQTHFAGQGLTDHRDQIVTVFLRLYTNISSADACA